MRRSVILKKIFSLTLWLLVLCSASGQDFVAQQPTGQSRTIEPADNRSGETIRDARLRTAASRSQRPRSPRAKKKAFDGEIGVTIMRQRPVTETAGGKTPNSPDKEKEMVFARIEDDMPLSAGDKVKISIEPSFEGYLYVVDRELYADGTRGRALLIFPTLSTYDGNNYIEPGQPRMINGPDISFEVTPNNNGREQIAERLTIIISHKRLALPRRLGSTEMQLDATLVEKWERDWLTGAIRTSTKDNIGKPQTERERAASFGGRELLTEKDPLPQNNYSVKVRPNTPTLIVVTLQYQSTARHHLRP